MINHTRARRIEFEECILEGGKNMERAFICIENLGKGFELDNKNIYKEF